MLEALKLFDGARQGEPKATAASSRDIQITSPFSGKPAGRTCREVRFGQARGHQILRLGR